MGTDIYDIFDKCAKASADDQEPITGESYFDFDKFLSAISEHGDPQRCLSMCRAIINAVIDNEQDNFLPAISEIISGDDEIQVTIIKHGYGQFEMNGEVPENCSIIMDSPVPDPLAAVPICNNWQEKMV